MNNDISNIKYNLLIKVLKNERTGKKILKYLSKEDEEHFILLNKEIYHLIINNNFLHYKYLTKVLKDEFIFYSRFKIEINNLSTIKIIIKESDKLFSSVYNQSQIMIIVFYFSFLILGIDLFFFFLIIGKDNIKERIKWYSQIPYIFLWFESLIIIIVYIVRIKRVISQIIQQIKTKIPNLNTKGINYLKKKIIYRINNLQPSSFWYISIYFLAFYLPILIKIVFEFLDTSYEKAYISVAWIVFIFFLLFDFIKLAYSVIKTCVTKIDNYQRIYNKGKSLYYLKKMKIIRKKEKRVFCGEFFLTLFLFIIKCVVFATILIYLRHLGRKFDNIKYKVKWKILFIPLYIINGIITIWGILYFYSIRIYETFYKIILFIILIIEISSSSFLGIALPLILDETWKLNLIYPAFGTTLLTISIIIHYCLIKKIKVNQNNKKCRKNSINVQQELFSNKNTFKSTEEY